MDDTENETEKSVDEDTPRIPPTETASRFYFRLTLNLAKDDLTKMEQIQKLPVYLVLNTASIQKDERIREQNELKKLQNQQRVRL